MFSDGDPFADVDYLIPKQDDTHSKPPATQPTTPVPVDQRYRFASQVPENPSTTVDNFTRSSPAQGRYSARRASGLGSLQRTEGYYVAFCAVLPGVYTSS